MGRGNLYQTILICSGIVATALFGIFLKRELFPEYKIYQNAYQKLEQLRSESTGEPVPFFKEGIKQIVIPASDNGPETVDRCTSCHVALQLEHFSSTKIARDINGNIVRDLEGKAVVESNENYVWGLVPYDDLSLRVADVGENRYDMTKVLAMHPLMGRETRPFEFHPIEEYGCTSCHSGNGRGLVTDRAHGPVFDGEYETERLAFTPQFLERDEKNDPRFASSYNDKPGGRLLFQITPLLVGNLIQSRCSQCHQATPTQIERAVDTLEYVSRQKRLESVTLKEALLNEQSAVIALVGIKRGVSSSGVEGLIESIEKKQLDISISDEELAQLANQRGYLKRHAGENLKKKVNKDLLAFLGSVKVAKDLEVRLSQADDTTSTFEGFVDEYLQKGYAKGSLFKKARTVKDQQAAISLLKTVKNPIDTSKTRQLLQSVLRTNVDALMRDYARGETLYISQACYACHRIAGIARGGVGPELTLVGHQYPWYIKESIVWPQADLKTSVMPNMRLDHEEIEDLMTFLLAQRNDRPSTSGFDKKIHIKAWEEGAKVAFEKPLPPSQIYDVNIGMKIFASEGCAACHRLKGYDSQVGFASEEDKEWFYKQIPDQALGSRIVGVLERQGDEVDKRFVKGASTQGILEEIEEAHPGLIESFYPNFKYAFRAKDYTQDPDLIKSWREKVGRLMMAYVQEYGLGRLIGPQVNWSGIYRSDQWLMEHFWNPTGHSARSIMPAFPFDNTKFLALAHMLDELAKENRKELREKWDSHGFNPQLAYNTLCASCHGTYLQGNGPVSEWIYPIPKNLKNAIFLRGQTKEMVRQSITHGIKGGPMAPWGEVGKGKEEKGVKPVLSGEEIDRLIDWLFGDLSGEYITPKEVEKWQYTPKDALKELYEEGDALRLKKSDVFSCLPRGEGFYAATDPWVPVEEHPEEADPWKPKEGYPKPMQVDEVFEHVTVGSRAPGYYIKSRFYTEKNLEEGQRSFMLNCSICHGREGDGTGLRAGTMQEAKPRMLTNLDWLETRDDMRLLQSIKYGVSGTAMTPWGDATTSLQRLQLVMFIRNLSIQQRIQERLSNALYSSFDAAKWEVERARSHYLNSLAETKDQLDALRLSLLSDKNKAVSELTNSLQKEVKLLNDIQEKEKIDSLLQQMIDLVQRNRTLFASVGKTIIAQSMIGYQDPLFPSWLELIHLYQNLFTFEGDDLHFNPPDHTQIAILNEQMIAHIDRIIEDYDKEAKQIAGRLPSIERAESMQQVEEQLATYRKLRHVIASSIAEGQRMETEQRKLYEQLNASV